MADSRWRIIAQRVPTGELLDWNVPLGRQTTSRELSGPGGVFGAVETEVLRSVADDGRPLLEEWSTALYVEEDGEIRAGGIIQKIDYEGPVKAVEAPGFLSYPEGIPFMDNYLPAQGYEDPTKVYENIWNHVQSFPDSNLGVRIDRPDTWMVLSSGSGPFTIRDHEARDCGDTLNSIAQACPFDFVEKHEWADDSRSRVDHKIEIGFPRLGRKRDDLRFTDSENIVSFSTITADGNRFANDVYVFGQGQGTSMRRSRAVKRDGRLRRATVVQLPAHGGQTYLNRLANRELLTRDLLHDISEVKITDSPNARISAIRPGDDVRVQVEVPWLGDVDLWLRVLAVDEAGEDPGRAVLKTQRSDFFAYSSAESPTGEKVAIQV